jgi:hypothetical protein
MPNIVARSLPKHALVETIGTREGEGIMHRKEFWSFVATIVLLGSLSPAAAGSVVAYAWDVGASKQVAYIATDGDIHELYVTAGDAWAEADLTALTANTASPAPQPEVGSPLAGYSLEWGGTKQVAYIAADRHIHELYCYANSGWMHADLTALAGGAPVADGSPLAGYAWGSLAQNRWPILLLTATSTSWSSK